MALVRGRYHVTNPFWSAQGQQTNVAQSDIAARSNADWFGYAGLTDAAAIATTGVSASVPVPVEIGDVITKITFVAGATAEATGTHSFLALYSGIATAPALLGQSTDNTAAGAVAASAVYTQSLTSPVMITAANAPLGFVYATICMTGGTMATLASYTTTAAVYYQYFTAAPLKGVAAVTHGSAQLGTAAATIASPTVAATTPLVFLT